MIGQTVLLSALVLASQVVFASKVEFNSKAELKYDSFEEMSVGLKQKEYLSTILDKKNCQFSENRISCREDDFLGFAGVKSLSALGKMIKEHKMRSERIIEHLHEVEEPSDKLVTRRRYRNFVTKITGLIMKLD